jgi:hypothetical protein
MQNIHTLKLLGELADQKLSRFDREVSAPRFSLEKVLKKYLFALKVQRLNVQI